MTEKYDPEKHGDAAYRLQSFDVVPVVGSEVRVWSKRQGSQELYRSQSFWFDEKTCWGDVYGFVGEAAGWTLLPKPAKPEPPKSYAEYLVDYNDFDIDELAYCRDDEGQLVTFDLDLSTDRKRVRAKALIEAIQDTLNQQNEAG